MEHQKPKGKSDPARLCDEIRSKQDRRVDELKRSCDEVRVDLALVTDFPEWSPDHGQGLPEFLMQSNPPEGK